MNKVFLLLCLCILFGCTNVSYVGETTAPVEVYETADLKSNASYTIPRGVKVLSKKQSKKFYHLTYQSKKGYAYNPSFANFHRYRSSVDGDLYGYTTNKPKSGGGSSYTNSSSNSYKPKTVNVKGYTKKNGTYVAPHTRGTPSRSGRRN
jgi:uncharacterized protein with WD repeat